MSQSESTALIIIPGHWIGHFIGEEGSFARNIRRTYHVGYDIKTKRDAQGYKIGHIHITGRHVGAAEAVLMRLSTQGLLKP